MLVAILYNDFLLLTTPDEHIEVCYLVSISDYGSLANRIRSSTNYSLSGGRLQSKRLNGSLAVSVQDTVVVGKAGGDF